MRISMENGSARSRRPGFTLVEILTVVVIIGILMGLVTATVGPVRRMVKNWRMKSEILQLTLGLEQVKTTIGGGEYPPDGSNAADVQRFLRRAFPRATYTYAAVTVGNRAMIQVQIGSNKYFLGLLPETAICFWLGGIRDASGNFVGLSADPTDPFNLNDQHAYSPNTPESRIGPFFDFDKSRIYQVLPSDNDVEKLSYDNGLLTRKDSNNQNCQFYLGFTAYFPQNDQALKTPTVDERAPDMDYAPYLYFKPVSAMYSDMAAARKSPPENTSEAYHWWQQPSDKVYITPVKDAKSASSLATTANCVTRAWINPTSFQILCPGLDGQFGASRSGSFSGGTPETADKNGLFAPIYPDGLNYADATKDDVTNFSNGKLEADMP